MTEEMERPAPRGLQWLGLLLALGGPAVVVGVLHSPLVSLPELQHREAAWAAVWGLVLALFALVVFGERRSLASIGLKRLTGASLLWGLIAAALAILAFPACAAVLAAMGIDSQPSASSYAALAALPLWARLMTVVTAAVCEEVLYRGYPITRLQALTGSRVLAVVLPAIVFVALHAPSWGVAHLLYVSVVTVIMTVLFLWRGDLWSNITAHFITDLVPFVLMPLFMHR